MQPEQQPSMTPAEQRQRALQLLFSAASPEKSQVRKGLLLLLIAAGLEAIGPWLGKAFIDQYLLPRQLAWTEIIPLLAAFLISGWIATWLRYRQLVRLAGVAMRSVQRLREQVYSHVLKLPMAFFDRSMTGQLVSRVTNDTEAVKNLYVQVLFVMLDSSIVVIGAMTGMLLLEWRLFLVVLPLIPAVVLIVWFYQRWSAPAVARARQLRSDINAQLAESLQGMHTLQASRAEQRFAQRFDQTGQQHYAARLQELKANAWLLRPALDFLNILILVIVIFSFSQQRFSGVEIGILYAFVSYIARVVEPLIQITMQFGQIQQAIVSAARVNTLLQEPAAEEKASHAQMQSGSIRILDLSFSYQTGKPVLKNIDLNIENGQMTGIVGHTGSGKSTLLSLLLRFYEADSGTILIDDQPVHAYGTQHFRERVGLVPQEPYLLAASIADNIRMGRDIAEDEVIAAAKAAHIHDFICGFEHGYATQLGTGGVQLSSGQKQLIAIARALAGKPQVLFLDEATSHIDSETEQIVQQTLNELRGKVTVVAIAHRLSTIRDADQIIVLNHGVIAEQGQHASLMQIEQGIYQRLYTLQTLEERETI
ncbi:ABC transporter ATP-binding protein [Undibacterium squillarum]|uniref:Multidrug ABC transporter ATP-binding protein n=1 Tax=Undibacterium squillarum TaxID=1131567 RepID=A0ABQ2XZ62_9BURK|nr:ABC transporter transmembrane domain-containing protein [Undibacterium squillarum]GGX42292.1 multidrug ABC transporter ATP-binding protein [Undibacterium squillarum]